MRLDHAAIEALVPHRGPMCLLHAMESWSETGIVCTANNFRDPHHPLRSRSGLLATASIEYAAQAMALHGALLGSAAGQSPSAGYLASARGVELSRWRLDDLPLHDLFLHGLPFDEPAIDAAAPRRAATRPLDSDMLRIEATRQAGDGRQVLYAFTVEHRSLRIAEGRAAVVLNTPPTLRRAPEPHPNTT